MSEILGCNLVRGQRSSSIFHELSKVAGTLRRAVRWSELTMILVNGTWNVPTTTTFVGCVLTDLSALRGN